MIHPFFVNFGLFFKEVFFAPIITFNRKKLFFSYFFSLLI
ncbi:hypothetical protein RV14_GL001317 [Enterococcus ratti]|uniref:Uncharacterized protein n=1 Tax=Enterococcus ratti TaxID=150033 RepID=A0A1L8WR08_9ENTE|nr:hypothetical protein RV14_GL001317 [Enterococcus ratti]